MPKGIRYLFEGETLKKIINFFSRLCEAYLPDAFVFCLVLTLVVFGMSLAFTDNSSVKLVEFWGKEFWSLHAFSMQMVFVLLTGHMLATTPVVQKCLKAIGGFIKTEKSALLFLSLFSIAACWINWGFGLIASGVLAVEFARRLRKVNFGLFVATAYAGFLVWHGGLSGSIPLKIAGQDEVLAKIYPELSIPLQETIFSHWNISILLLLVFALPLIAVSMMSQVKNEITLDESSNLKEEINVPGLRKKLEGGKFLNRIFFVMFLIYLLNNRTPLDINRVNFIFLFLSLLLHETPRHFLKALEKSVVYCSGIIIQFPFYAGIMGLMQHSGLADQISALFVSISTKNTLPLWSFLSGGVVNFFIPSGGGQWVVQGPVMLKAAKTLGADPAKVSMALAWGDAWTNLIQPFWALPLLALAKIQLKDIMGHCLIYTIVSGLIISGVFIFI